MRYFFRKFGATEILRTLETVHSQGETFIVAQRSQSYKEPILGLMHLRLQFYDRLGDRRLLAKIERHLGHCRNSPCVRATKMRGGKNEDNCRKKRESRRREQWQQVI